MTGAIETDRLVLLLAGVATLLLAGAVLSAAPGRPAHRALAALLALRGVAVLLPQLSTDPGWREDALLTQPYFALAIVPVAIYLVLASRPPFALQASPPGSRGWWTLAAAVALDVLYAADHSLFQTLAPGTAANRGMQAAAGIQYTAFGPLAALASLGIPLLALLGLRLAVTYRAKARDREAATLLLLAGGFLLGGLFDGTSRLSALVTLLDAPQGYAWWPWGWAVAAVPVLALAPAALGVIVLAAGRTSAPRPQRALEGRILLFSAFAASSGFLRLIGPADANPAGHAMVLILLGFWRLAMPVLVTAALVLAAWDDVDGRGHEALAWILLALLVVAPGVGVAFTLLPRTSLPAAILWAVAASAILAVMGRLLLRGTRVMARWLLPAPHKGRQTRLPLGEPLA